MSGTSSTSSDLWGERSDICVYGCTGNFGSNVARLICELAVDTDTANDSGEEHTLTLLLGGRNPVKVQRVGDELLLHNAKKKLGDSKVAAKVRVLSHPKAVTVDDPDALADLARLTRVLVNCTKIISNENSQRSTARIAEACLKANTHYVDIATTLPAIAPVISCANSIPGSKSKLVPACGFDYAFFDVAAAKAEQALADMRGRSICNPKEIQMVLAILPGPQGFKWRVDSIGDYFEKEQLKKNGRTSAYIYEVPPLAEQPTVPFLSYCSPAGSMSIPWFLGRDVVRYFIHLRKPQTYSQIDARLALPRQPWRAAACGFYAVFLALVFYPLLRIAYWINFAWSQQLLLKAITILSFGFFTENIEEMTEAIHKVQAKLYITLTSIDTCNGQDVKLLYQVSAPSVYIEHECAAIAAMELAKDTKVDRTGILSPAQALTGTDFFQILQDRGFLKVSAEIVADASKGIGS